MDKPEVHCQECDWEGLESDLDVDGEWTQEDGLVCDFMCPKCGSQEIEDI